MNPSFLALPANSLQLADKDVLTQALSSHPQALSGYTFAPLISWDPIFRYEWGLGVGGTLFISCLLGPELRRHLMQPLGIFPPDEQTRLLREAALLPYPLRIVGVGEVFLGASADFARHFDIVEDSAASNYLYLAEDLAQLPGRKYARKRNLISQAQGLYEWTTEDLTASGTNGCREILQRIQEEEKPEIDINLQQELTALEHTLHLWPDLNQQGILLRVGGRPVAFSIFEPIGGDTVAIHFERALRSYKGLYQVINWETARVVAAQGYEFINREEDLGSPGLREAKRSYSPIQLIPAYELTLR